MRLLALIRTARFDAVLRADRDVKQLFLIAVVVADQQRVAAVFILVPAFKRRVDVEARVLQRFHDQLLLRVHSCARETRRDSGRRGHAPDLQHSGNSQTNEGAPAAAPRELKTNHYLITAAGDRSWSPSSACAPRLPY